eukprot:m.163804 g.163804  ORF g.163804 m.163804 type:complete len:69 (+) comp13418_c1_seq13:2264-2470(+)
MYSELMYPFCLQVLNTEVKRNRHDWEVLKEQGPYHFITPYEVLTAKTKSAVVGELHKRHEKKAEEEKK